MNYEWNRLRRVARRRRLFVDCFKFKGYICYEHTLITINNMTRPKKDRVIKCSPAAYYFKPRGIPMSELEEVILEPDELEALRLADYLDMPQEEAARQMNISRATFGRIAAKARKKVAGSILNGNAIRISENMSSELKDKYKPKCFTKDISENKQS